MDNFIIFFERYRRQDTCKKILVEARWGKGKKQDIVCPYCGHHHCTPRKDGRFCCSHCNHNFSYLVGTIFQNTKIQLRIWYAAIYILMVRKNGISSYQLKKELGITQKTAWFIMHKIRNVFASFNSKGATTMLKRLRRSLMNITIRTKTKRNKILTVISNNKATSTERSTGGQFARVLIGTHHHLCSKYLSFYIREFFFRKNHAHQTLTEILQRSEFVITYLNIKNSCFA